MLRELRHPFGDRPLPSRAMDVNPIRILIAEPVPLIGELLADRLTAEGFEIVAVAPDGSSAHDLVLQHQPDLVILDIELRDPDGISTIRDMVRADRRFRILVLTSSDDVLSARYAMQAGAVGFVSKSGSFPDLVRAIRTVLAGDTVILHRSDDPKPGSALTIGPLLSDREEEVLSLVAAGLTNPEIAERLFISARTVKNHLSSIYDKLGVGDKTQALIRAVRLGIVRFE